jgi:hypothetical protein
MPMRRIAFLLVGILCSIDRPAAACTFCAGGLGNRLTLREQFLDAKFVALGTLKNPKPDPDGVGGSTEFHVTQALKTDPAVAKPMHVLPRYMPVIGDTPPDYVLFCGVANGKIDPLRGVPGSAAVADYVRQAAKLDPKDSAARLAYFFQHLDSEHKTIAEDAFHEFGKASDAEIVKAKPHLDPAKLRKLIADPKTPDDRVGVFAMMLGLCGGKPDGEWLASELAANPLPERYAANLGGVLAGLTLLDPKIGWQRIETLLADGKRPPHERLAGIGSVRFFQGTRPDARADVLKCYRAVISQGELADLAIDDLRRWAWWDLTADVLAVYASKNAPLFRRGVVRYALCCPTAEAKAFVAAVREKEPKLVASVEESLKLFEKR